MGEYPVVHRIQRKGRSLWVQGVQATAVNAAKRGGGPGT
jgi:hypothetical protein